MKKQQLLYRLPILIFLILLFFSCKDDNRIGKSHPENILRIDSLNQLASNNALLDSAKLSYAQKALSEATQNNYPKGKCEAFNLIGFIETNKGNFELAKISFDSSLLHGKQMEDLLSISQSLQGLGELYLSNGLLSDARQYFLDANIFLKDIESNERHLEEESILFRSLGNVNLGLAQSSVALYDSIPLATEYTEKAIKYYEKVSYQRGITRVYLDLGKFYSDADSIAQATANYKTALELSSANKDTLSIAQSQNGLGIVNLFLKNYDLAEDYFQKAKAGFKSRNSIPEIFNANYSLCEIWLEKGLIKKAEGYADSLLRPVFKLENRFVDKEYAAFLFAEIYKESISENSLPQLADSIMKYKELQLDFSYEGLDEVKMKETAIAETLHGVKLKDIKLSKKEADNRSKTTQRNWLLLALLLGLGIALLFYSNFKKEKALASEKLEKQELQIEQQQFEFEDIIQKAEVNAANSVVAKLDEERKIIARMIHDKLGSSLVTVNRGLKEFFNESGKIIIEKEVLESYTKNLDEVYRELREISHQLDEQADFSLTEKLESFCDLFSHSGKLRVEFVKNGDFSELDSKMKNQFFLMSKELITNILKHADASLIEVQLMSFEKMLSLTMIDNGKGFDTEKTTLGFGLSKMKENVESLGGVLVIDSTVGIGTTVIIDIPK